MKNKIRDYISEIEEDTDNEDFNDDEDPLSDVRDNRRGTLLSARNIPIALIALTIVFFGGYFAAFALAHEKYLQTEAELSICRSSIESSRKEIATLKDSVDVLNRRLAEQVQTVSVQSEADINH